MKVNANSVVLTVNAPHFNAGVVWNSFTGKVEDAAPIVRYMIGWTKGEVLDYCFRKGWKLEH